MPASREAALLFDGPPGRNRRDLITPEGVALPVELATYGERATAFMLDFFLWFVASLVAFILILYLAFGLGSSGMRSAGVFAVGVLLFITFLIRVFYFLHFELAWQGATPGKRMVGLRVIDRQGGPLLPRAVIARNLMREMEFFLPFSLLLSLRDGTVWEGLATAGWMLGFLLLPLFNRDRLRGGDLLGGTIVIALPQRRLLGDLVEQALAYRFTEKQLAAYGAFELQVLEELLRRPEVPGAVRLAREVCDKICRKIAWPEPVPDASTIAFLKAFYTAERAYLEREQLFGKPRADKHQAKAGD